jgi:hypothetical protein
MNAPRPGDFSTVDFSRFLLFEEGHFSSASRDGREEIFLVAAGFICSATLLLEANPSPATVTVMVVVLPAAGAVSAVNVKVSVLVLAPAAGVCGFADHFAVTPEGKPLSE